MSRAINIISQIIHLSKKAKILLKHNKPNSAIRILKTISRIEHAELKNILRESNSKEFYEECKDIFEDIRNIDHNINILSKQQIMKLLDRIIQMERHQLKNIVEPSPGLSKAIIDKIDPYIRELVLEINRLSFVKKTTASCSGHFPFEWNMSNLWNSKPSRFGPKPYFVVEYDYNSKTEHNIKHFHNAMKDICSEVTADNALAPKEVVYRLGFRIKSPHMRTEEDLRRQFAKQINLIFRLVKKFRDNDSLMYAKEKMYIKKHPEILGKPDSLIGLGIIVKCPECHCYMLAKKPRKCNFCKYKFGSLFGMA